MRAEAPSINMIKAHIQTEIAPIVGSEEQARDLIAYMKGKRQKGRKRHLGYQYFWEIHRTDCRRRHSGKNQPDDRGLPVPSPGRSPENHQRQQRRNDMHHHLAVPPCPLLHPLCLHKRRCRRGQGDRARARHRHGAKRNGGVHCEGEKAEIKLQKRRS